MKQKPNETKMLVDKELEASETCQKDTVTPNHYSWGHIELQNEPG